MKYDLFVSHASEDKETVVRPLVARLKSQGLRVWYDEDVLRLGDSLLTEINRGLTESRYGLVVLSPAFLGSEWTLRELKGLLALDEVGRSTILPIWHGVTHEDLVERFPILADAFAIDTARGLDHVVTAVMAALQVSDVAIDERPEAAPQVDGRLPGTTNDVADKGTVIFVHGLYGAKSPFKAIGDLADDPTVGGWMFTTFAWSGKMFSGATPLDLLAADFVRDAERALQQPGKLVVVAHSIGGLIAMQAILGSSAVRARLKAFIMITVPTAGVRYGSLLGFFNRGLREISIGGETVTDLSRRWAEIVGDEPSFAIESIVATHDLVTPASSLSGARVTYIDASHSDASRDPMVTRIIKAALTGSGLE